MGLVLALGILLRISLLGGLLILWTAVIIPLLARGDRSLLCRLPEARPRDHFFINHHLSP